MTTLRPADAAHEEAGPRQAEPRETGPREVGPRELAAPEGTTPRQPIALVPRLAAQGYDEAQVAKRRTWVEAKTCATLEHVGRFSIPSESFRGNIENPIGAIQMPLGVAGPLLVEGVHARGTYYVPLATTEGALVRSYERGMVAITRAGGASARVWTDENRVSPMLVFASVAAAHEFAEALPEHLDALREETKATTRHGALLRATCMPVGREVILDLAFHTADAQGMNMIVKAAERICRWLADRTAVEKYSIFSGYNGEKRAAGNLLAGGKGKKVCAGVQLPRRVVKALLHTTPEALCNTWRQTVVGHLAAGAIGYNGHLANGLTAIFLATGQDVANVANAAVGLTQFEMVGEEGDLYASVTLPALTVATVGGGTGLGTSRECLAMLDCEGTGGARRLAEIIASAALAGELSMGAAIATGEFVAAHETYGRNRPVGKAS